MYPAVLDKGGHLIIQDDAIGAIPAGYISFYDNEDGAIILGQANVLVQKQTEIEGELE